MPRTVNAEGCLQEDAPLLVHRHLQGVAPEGRPRRAGTLLAARPGLHVAALWFRRVKRLLWPPCRLERAHRDVALLPTNALMSIRGAGKGQHSPARPAPSGTNISNVLQGLTHNPSHQVDRCMLKATNRTVDSVQQHPGAAGCSTTCTGAAAAGPTRLCEPLLVFDNPTGTTGTPCQSQKLPFGVWPQRQCAQRVPATRNTNSSRGRLKR